MRWIRRLSKTWESVHYEPNYGLISARHRAMQFWDIIKFPELAPHVRGPGNITRIVFRGSTTLFSWSGRLPDSSRLVPQLIFSCSGLIWLIADVPQLRHISVTFLDSQWIFYMPMVMDDTASWGWNIIFKCLEGNHMPYCKTFGNILPQGCIHASVYLRKIMYYQLVGVLCPTGHSRLKRWPSR